MYSIAVFPRQPILVLSCLAVLLCCRHSKSSRKQTATDYVSVWVEFSTPPLHKHALFQPEFSRAYLEAIQVGAHRCAGIDSNAVDEKKQKDVGKKSAERWECILRWGTNCLLAEEKEQKQERSNAFADIWPCPPTTTSVVCPTRLGISSVWPASQKRLRSTNSPLLASNFFYSTQCNRFGLTLSVLLSNQYYHVTITPFHNAYQKYRLFWFSIPFDVTDCHFCASQSIKRLFLLKQRL